MSFASSFQTFDCTQGKRCTAVDRKPPRTTSSVEITGTELLWTRMDALFTMINSSIVPGGNPNTDNETTLPDSVNYKSRLPKGQDAFGDRCKCSLNTLAQTSWILNVVSFLFTNSACKRIQLIPSPEHLTWHHIHGLSFLRDFYQLCLYFHKNHSFVSCATSSWSIKWQTELTFHCDSFGVINPLSTTASNQ